MDDLEGALQAMEDLEGALQAGWPGAVTERRSVA
jgi:hypothetical protein